MRKLKKKHKNYNSSIHQNKTVKMKTKDKKSQNQNTDQKFSKHMTRNPTLKVPEDVIFSIIQTTKMERFTTVPQQNFSNPKNTISTNRNPLSPKVGSMGLEKPTKSS